MIRVWPERHQVWPNPDLDVALIFLDEEIVSQDAYDVYTGPNPPSSKSAKSAAGPAASKSAKATADRRLDSSSKSSKSTSDPSVTSAKSGKSIGSSSLKLGSLEDGDELTISGWGETEYSMINMALPDLPRSIELLNSEDCQGKELGPGMACAIAKNMSDFESGTCDGDEVRHLRLFVPLLSLAVYTSMTLTHDYTILNAHRAVLLLPLMSMGSRF